MKRSLNSETNGRDRGLRIKKKKKKKLRIKLFIFEVASNECVLA